MDNSPLSKIEFKCIIEDYDEDGNYEFIYEAYAHTMLVALEATIQSDYKKIRGLLSFHYKGKKLRNDLEKLGNIIQRNSDEPLIIRMDKTKPVVSRAVGKGAVASGPGFAGGGSAGGAAIDNGTAIAGTGVGGNLEAKSGIPGAGHGGNVWDPDGIFVNAIGGDGVVGRAVLTGQSNESRT